MKMPMPMGDPPPTSIGAKDDVFDRIYANMTFNVDALMQLLNWTSSEERAVVEGFIEHPNWNCDGHPNVWSGGNWTGHVVPACIFIFWATHWLFGFIRHYFDCQVRNKAYQSKAHFRFLCFPEQIPLESIIKFAVPFMMPWLEVWLAHPDGYKNLICGRGTEREGHMSGEHIGNWAHASMYPGFMISGLVDLICLRLDARNISYPQGIQQLFLGLGFLGEALLMSLHKKHTPMDVMVHNQLSYGMLACAFFAVLEVGWPEAPLLTAGRIASTYLQGAWFIGLARAMYEGTHPAWDTQGDFDLAPVIYAPIFYLHIILGILTLFLSAFLLGWLAYKRPPMSPQSHTSAHPDRQLPLPTSTSLGMDGL